MDHGAQFFFLIVGYIGARCAVYAIEHMLAITEVNRGCKHSIVIVV